VGEYIQEVSAVILSSIYRCSDRTM